MIPTCQQIGTGMGCSNPAAYVLTYAKGSPTLACWHCVAEPTAWNVKDGHEEATPIRPYVGMPATVRIGSDRHAGTVIFVSSKATKITVQQDRATRTDSNGMSDSQTYEYERDPDGRCDDFFRNAAGGYGKAGHRITVTLGVRDQWHDYSF